MLEFLHREETAWDGHETDPDLLRKPPPGPCGIGFSGIGLFGIGLACRAAGGRRPCGRRDFSGSRRLSRLFRGPEFRGNKKRGGCPGAGRQLYLPLSGHRLSPGRRRVPERAFGTENGDLRHGAEQHVVERERDTLPFGFAHPGSRVGATDRQERIIPDLLRRHLLGGDHVWTVLGQPAVRHAAGKFAHVLV